MARPKKTGMDYFPHDTDACSDEKIEVLRALYGNDGYAFYFIMLERIYRSENFELKIAEVSEAETGQKTVINDAEMVQILSKKLMLAPELFEKILLTCIQREIFSEKKYTEKGLLTSEGIKKRTKPILEKRRKMAESYSNKALVSEAETKQKPSRKQQKPIQKPDKEKERKDKEKNSIFIKPTIQEISDYCLERNNGIDPEKFFDHYESNGWIRGKTKIKDWKACVRTWENKEKKPKKDDYNGLGSAW